MDAIGVAESVAVSVTVNDLADVKVCVTTVPVAVLPSPKFQLLEYGVVPPVVTAVNVTGTLIVGLDGAIVKLVCKGCGGRTLRVFELDAV